MKKIPKKDNFFRNLIKNKIFIEKRRELWICPAPGSPGLCELFPRHRNRNRFHNPIKRLHLFYYQRTLLPSITSALGRYSQNRSICRFF